MKRFSIIIGALLAAATVAWSCALAGETVESEPAILIFNDYKYAINENNTAYILGYTGAAAEIVIPSDIDGLPVAGFASGAFTRNKTLTGVTIPGSIARISYGSFMNCTNLTTVVAEEGVKQFGYRPQGFA